jgi:two-component system nitrogen regulation sensor histidine kinase NtrY
MACAGGVWNIATASAMTYLGLLGNSLAAAPARRWAQHVGLGGKLAIALALAAFGSGVATFVALTPGASAFGDVGVVRSLLLLDLVLLLLLLAVVARHLVGVWVARRRGSAGAKLHARMVGLFSAVALAPAIVMAVFSALFFEVGLDNWFSSRVETAVKESVAVADAYVAEHRNAIQADVLAMAADLNREAPRLMRNTMVFNQVMSGQARLRNLPEAIAFDTSGRVLARSGLSLVMEFERLPAWALKAAGRGEVAVLTSGQDDRVRALVRLDGFLDAYLYVGRFVDPRVLDHVERSHAAAAQYLRLQAARSDLVVTLSALFIVVALLVLLAAIWFGLTIATRIAEPIGRIVAAAERVRSGDLSARVPEDPTDDELGILNRAFNRMTGELVTRREELMGANAQLDERRRFIETVLAGVSAGVIGIDPGGRITLANPSALRLLELPADGLIGRRFDETVAELAPLLDATAGGDAGQSEGQVAIVRRGKTRELLVQVAREVSDGDTAGFVVTFDDVTDLLGAQRTAAWADVARRIAHEIKNPLTPIRLSAERLKRKYLADVAHDPETFTKCTDTIIRQVGDIGRMVDEFSAFARLPAPTFRRESLTDLVQQAIFTQNVGHGEIEYVAVLPAETIWARCDGRQIAQALTNLLKNAGEAIEGRAPPQPGGEAAPNSVRPGGAPGEPPLPKGRVEVRLSRRPQGGIEIAVIDNGRGLPAEHRARLTEPYVTTRAKGTGLGLAIVRKIMEEHGGEVALADAAIGGAGACVSLLLPAAAEIRDNVALGAAPGAVPAGAASAAGAAAIEPRKVGHGA